MTDQLVETASAVFTNKTTQIGAYTSTGAGIVSAISKLDVVAQVLLFVAIVSLAFTVFSFAMNWYYKHQQHKREAELQKQKIKLMVEGKWHGQD
ncbi:phage holin family protein [Acinetobacter rathckeae]|uniref:hypothetical protein n=1 Tax=Acinetobacter rathckeae TaxID=2605272 RepID=UPI0018A25625|nr:hypothetical protein [Acinetobacter rathckeae]MBF7696608.1 hypothetical protein [Acinetobacter rathckeae]